MFFANDLGLGLRPDDFDPRLAGTLPLPIKRPSVVLSATFSLPTMACALMRRCTPYRISGGMLAEGQAFELPSAAVGVVVAAFGLTGVGGNEVDSYSCRCIGKGYAARSGPYDGSTRRQIGPAAGFAWCRWRP